MANSEPQISNLAAGLSSRMLNMNPMQNVPNNIPMNLGMSNYANIAAVNAAAAAAAANGGGGGIGHVSSSGTGVPQTVKFNLPPNNANMGEVTGGVVGEVNSDTVTILGQTMQRKYAYLLGVLLFLLVGYMLWKWLNKKNEEEDEYDSDEEELGYMGPPEMYPGLPHPSTHPPTQPSAHQNQEEMFQQMQHMQRMKQMQQMQQMQHMEQMRQMQQMQQNQKNQEPMTDQQFNENIQQAIDEVEV